MGKIDWQRRGSLEKLVNLHNMRGFCPLRSTNLWP
jgi:hypothetical protein